MCKNCTTSKNRRGKYDKDYVGGRRINMNKPNKIKTVGTTKWEDMCMDCGKVRYPEVRKNAFNGIGISLGRCKVCRNEEGIIPARDWMYRAGVLNKIG